MDKIGVFMIFAGVIAFLFAFDFLWDRYVEPLINQSKNKVKKLK